MKNDIRSMVTSMASGRLTTVNDRGRSRARAIESPCSDGSDPRRRKNVGHAARARRQSGRPCKHLLRCGPSGSIRRADSRPHKTGATMNFPERFARMTWVLLALACSPLTNAADAQKPAAAASPPAAASATPAPGAPAPATSGGAETGLAAVYSDKLNGRKTASGERYDRNALTAAHKTLPFHPRQGHPQQEPEDRHGAHQRSRPGPGRAHPRPVARRGQGAGHRREGHGRRVGGSGRRGAQVRQEIVGALPHY